VSEDEAGASSQSDEAGAEALPKDWSFTSHLGEDLRGANLSGADLRRAVSMALTWRVLTFRALICAELRSSARI